MIISTWIIFSIIHLVALGFLKSEKSNHYMYGATTFYLFALLTSFWHVLGIVAVAGLFGYFFQKMYGLERIEINSCTWLITGLALEGFIPYVTFIISYSVFNGVLELSKHFGKEITGDQHTMQLLCLFAAVAANLFLL